MSNNEKYENAPADIAEAIEQAEVIPDFLPPPEQLVLPRKSRTFTQRNFGIASVKPQE